MASTINGTKERVNFGKIKLPSYYPDLLEIQLKSFQEFFQLETTPENRNSEGLYRVFQETSQLRIPEIFLYSNSWIIS
ncbi:MAG TPA: hypothetical protein PLV12_12690 [Saprospiraceae bacterium]|nr:hypothetical protein [Saprospiraceae bacterium]